MQKALQPGIFALQSTHQQRKRTNKMNTTTQATQYRTDLAKARAQLVAVKVFDRSILRNTRIAELSDYISTLELALSLCEADDAQFVEDMAASA